MTRRSPPLVWIITNGRQGDLVPCRAIAAGLSKRIEEKTVNPCAPFSWFMPYGPIDPRERDLVNAPYPDLIVASGRRAVPYVRALHQATNQLCRAVFIKYPGCDVSKFGLLWVPDHDRRTGTNVISTLTSPHGISNDLLATQREQPDDRLAKLKGPRLGIVLGGNSRHVTYDAAKTSTFCALLKDDLPFESFLVTGSRRTPPALLTAVRDAIGNRPNFIWDGTGDNPYFSILTNSYALLVTGDSHNLVSEALVAGIPVHVFDPPGNALKFTWAIEKMREQGWIEPLEAPIQPGIRSPHNATPNIIAEIKQRFAGSFS